MRPDSALDVAPLRRALVVDDEDGVRGVLRRWLGRRGWEVTEAADGDAARASLAHGTATSSAPAFELVICDLRMPTSGGEELHAWISAHHPALLRRLVFASGDTGEAATAAFLQYSGCPVLEKPFELRRLEATIATVLDRAAEQALHDESSSATHSTGATAAAARGSSSAPAVS